MEVVIQNGVQTFLHLPNRVIYWGRCPIPEKAMIKRKILAGTGITGCSKFQKKGINAGTKLWEPIAQINLCLALKIQTEITF